MINNINTMSSYVKVLKLVQYYNILTYLRKTKFIKVVYKMDKRLENYDYSRKILFMEDKVKKFKENIGESKEKEIDFGEAQIMNSIDRRQYDGNTYDLLQNDDTILGWMNLENSPQIFRFPARQCKIYDEKYFDNSINESLGKTRNYKLLFKDKIVFTKCVVTFEGEKYYGIFINNKFHGFHHEIFVDLFIETDIILETKIDNVKLYKISNFTKVFE